MTGDSQFIRKWALFVFSGANGDPTPPTWNNLGGIGHLFWLDRVAGA